MSHEVDSSQLGVGPTDRSEEEKVNSIDRKNRIRSKVEIVRDENGKIIETTLNVNNGRGTHIRISTAGVFQENIPELLGTLGEGFIRLADSPEAFPTK